MSYYFRCNVKENEIGMRLDQFLASMDQIVSRTQAQRLLKSGNVLLNGVSVSAPSRRVYSGQSIALVNLQKLLLKRENLKSCMKILN